MPEQSFVLPPQWAFVSDGRAARLEAELHREMCKEHVLYGVPAKAIAQRITYDDYLFQIPDGVFVGVHLTWSVETSPQYPWTELFGSFEEWKASFEEDSNMPPIS